MSTLPVTFEEVPVLARRGCRIAWDGGDRFTFASLYRDTTFSIDADARCLCGLTGARPSGRGLAIHSDVPDPDGQCGFYAVPPTWPTWMRHDLHGVVVLVELSGVIVEHERGFRAAHQRVLELERTRCAWCVEAATVAGVSGRTVTWFSCGRHTPAPGERWPLQTVADRLGVPLTEPLQLT